ncbi:hypothetical protein [Asanoa siamensis]|uniref:Uncharacterized protein n=1 Tax=Asanoa siamensis TaxID=926357 RepID=A0ABQ4CLA2_9ACTN|nr:hypothetical protein [Asanoa siamensis]GIF72054.1 hypothetical protein Asi02nite_15720 [Asanoa siamensis]
MAASSATLIVGIIAASITAVGWLVNYVVTAAIDRRKQHAAARLAHVERQLEKLYGPLMFLVEEGESSFRDLLGTLGRRYVFSGSRELPEAELELWLFWVDHDLMPRNVAIQSLLSTQTHLIVGHKLPPSYLDFVDHYNSWRITHLRWKEEGVRYGWTAKVNWPDSFTADVRATFAQLKQEQAALLGTVVSRSLTPKQRPRTDAVSHESLDRAR